MVPTGRPSRYQLIVEPGAELFHPLSARYCVARKLNHGSNSWMIRPYSRTAKRRMSYAK